MWHNTVQNPDVATLKLAIRLLDVFLSYNGIKEGAASNKTRSCNYNKNVYRDWTKGPAVHFRDYTVVRSFALLLKRGETGMLEMSKGAGELIDSLVMLCTHE